MEKIHVRTSLTTFVAGELIRIIGFLDIICVHKKIIIYIFFWVRLNGILTWCTVEEALD